MNFGSALVIALLTGADRHVGLATVDIAGGFHRRSDKATYSAEAAGQQSVRERREIALNEFGGTDTHASACTHRFEALQRLCNGIQQGVKTYFLTSALSAVFGVNVKTGLRVQGCTRSLPRDFSPTKKALAAICVVRKMRLAATNDQGQEGQGVYFQEASA